LRRSDRGGLLKGLRLVGQEADESWPAESADPQSRAQPAASVSGSQSAQTYDDAAAWIKRQLASTRSGGGLAMLCLDSDGAVCSWITSPSASPSVISAIARQGGMPTSSDSAAELSESRVSAAPLSFYGALGLESSIQALGTEAQPAADRPGRSFRTMLPGVNGAPASVGPAPTASQRLAVLAIADVPARLLLDALDRAPVLVETVGSLWHAIAMAWDAPVSRPAAVERIVAEATAVAATIIIDPEGRLLWTWSEAGRLLLGGSMRLRIARTADDGLGTDSGAIEPASSDPVVQYGPDEVARLTAEWLAWSAQLGRAPTRITCILMDQVGEVERSPSPAEFGHRLGESWPGATVDVLLQADPVGTTLARVARALENTPAEHSPPPTAGSALVELSQRPGRQHRRMYTWASAAIVMGALGIAAAAWQLNASAGKAKAASQALEQRWREVLKQTHPTTMTAQLGKGPYQVLQEEIARLEAAARPIERDPVMPVLQELETVSMVVGNSGYAIESIEMDTTGRPRVIAISDNTPDAEALLEALRRVGGSNVADWTATYAAKREGDANKVRGVYSGSWEKRSQPSSTPPAAGTSTPLASGKRPLSN